VADPPRGEEQECAIGWLAKFPIADDYPELHAYEPRES
jgi:hypothetical protein